MGLVDRIRLWWQIRTGKEDTPLDGDTPAWLTSLVLHLSVLIVLTLLTVAPRLADDDLSLVIHPTDVEDEVEPEEVHFSEDLPDDVGALGFGGSESPEADALTEDLASDVSAEIEMPVETGDVAIMAIYEPVAIAPDVSEQVLVKGVGSVGVTGAAGAIDRITHEILLSLEQRPTLVVWLFDQSGSLRSQREMIHNRLDRIYHELGVIKSAGNDTFARHEDKPLLTSVMEFGVGSRFVLEKPTDDIEKIKRAVREVQEDSSGREHVFQAILYAVTKYRNFRTRPRDRRNVMLVAFTDEAGDDIRNLDRAVEMCRRYAMPVYVVGVAAPFGRQRTFVKYVDPNPEFDQTPQWAPIDQGPESLMPERVRLGFVGGPRLEGEEPPIDSGFGPFGLTRLCFESGGIYFAIHPNRNTNGRVTRFETAEMAPFLSRFFDPQVMRRYRPDYVSVKDYHELLTSNRARRALVEAARLSWTTPMERVQTSFPKRSEPQLVADLSLAQRNAAKIEPKVGRIYETLRQGESDRAGLRKPRWQAGYDLAMGRTLAIKVRTEAYNAMLAQAKQGMTFKNERNDTWVLVPDHDIRVGSALEKQAQQAREYLDRVVGDHPDTPWALLARREMGTPLGWQWTERYTGVNAPPEQTVANNNRPPRDDRRRMLAPRKPRRPPPAL